MGNRGDGMGNRVGDSVGNGSNSVGNGGNGMGNRVGDHSRTDSMNKRSSMSNSVGHRNSLRVDSLSRVGDLSNIAINVIGVVVDSLDATIREADLVRSLDNPSAIVGFGSIEVSIGVVISHSIVVGVGGDLIRVDLNGMGHSHRGMVGWGGMGDHRGMIGRGSMDHGGSMNKRCSMGDSVNHRSSMGHGMNKRGPMKKRGGMDNRSMGDSVESRGGMN